MSSAPEMEPLEGLTLLGGIAFLVPTSAAPILTSGTDKAWGIEHVAQRPGARNLRGANAT